jgi:hypothetical protein
MVGTTATLKTCLFLSESFENTSDPPSRYWTATFGNNSMSDHASRKEYSSVRSLTIHSLYKVLNDRKIDQARSAQKYVDFHQVVRVPTVVPRWSSTVKVGAGVDSKRLAEASVNLDPVQHLVVSHTACWLVALNATIDGSNSAGE